MPRKKREEKRKQQNMSRAVLLRMFEDHQLESLGDLALKYRKLERSLGYRTMKFQEYMSSGGLDSGAVALHELEEIVRWKKQCKKWDLDPRGIELLARDNLSISGIMRSLNNNRTQIILHARCCLTVWSVNVNRCDIRELHRVRGGLAGVN